MKLKYDIRTLNIVLEQVLDSQVEGTMISLQPWQDKMSMGPNLYSRETVFRTKKRGDITGFIGFRMSCALYLDGTVCF
jgi:hypothetical protein